MFRGVWQDVNDRVRLRAELSSPAVYPLCPRGEVFLVLKTPLRRGSLLLFRDLIWFPCFFFFCQAVYRTRGRSCRLGRWCPCPAASHLCNVALSPVPCPQCIQTAQSGSWQLCRVMEQVREGTWPGPVTLLHHPDPSSEHAGIYLPILKCGWSGNLRLRGCRTVLGGMCELQRSCVRHLCPCREKKKTQGKVVC